jgi:hypothetical protein
MILRVKKCHFHYGLQKKICLSVKNLSLKLRSLSSSEDATKDEIFKIFCHGTLFLNVKNIFDTISSLLSSFFSSRRFQEMSSDSFICH